MFRSAVWSRLLLLVVFGAVFGSVAGGCGDDEGSPGSGTGTLIRLHPVPGCEAIDPAPCDVFSTECQTRLLALAACLRGSSPGPLPPVSFMTEREFAELLMAEFRAAEPPLNLGDLDAGLAMLGLVAPGAFAPSSMAATQASQVAGFYRDDVNDIVLVDHGSPANGIDVNGIDVNGTLLHEFVHALQDREQDLPTWFDAHTDTYDDTLAALSVVEGEARLHQTRFRVSLLGLDPMAVDWNKHFDRTVSLATQWVLEQPSPYLASYMAFPYEYGARLLFPRFTERGPQAVMDLFASPPAGTRALLDPGNDAVLPGWPTPVAPSPPAEWTLTHEMTLGTWATLLFLARAGSFTDPRVQALGWRGDRLWIYGGLGAAIGATTSVWRIAFADDATASIVAQGLTPRFNVQQSGPEVLIAVTSLGLPLDWAFATTAAAGARPGDAGAGAASNRSTDWIRRVFLRE
jgi:hypothetical protein